MEPNLSQALHLLNGDNTQARIKKGKVIDTMLAEKKPPVEILNQIYLTTLSRPPTDVERDKLLAAVGESDKPDDVRDTLEDVFWALLNSKEFIFNH